MKKMDGSMTIEAAMIVPLILIFIAAFIMGAMYLHDQIIVQVIQNQLEEAHYLDGNESATKQKSSIIDENSEIKEMEKLNEKLWLKNNDVKIDLNFVAKTPITTMQNIQVGWDVAGRMPILATAKLKIQNTVENWQERIKKLLESR